MTSKNKISNTSQNNILYQVNKTIQPDISTKNKYTENVKDKNSIETASSSMKLISACIIGKPNAGKSTLLNYIIGQKLSIVTHKVQTTRSIITGITTIGDTQIVLFDTPGIFEPKKSLEKAMVRCAWSSINSADIVALIIDSSRSLCGAVKKILLQLATLKLPIILLLNKIDLKHKFSDEDRKFLEDTLGNILIFPISALSGYGVNNFLNFLQLSAYKSHWLYDGDDITNLPMRFLASEITREQLFLNLHQELPYSLTVENEQWETLKDGSVKINQVIIVGSESHKKIIIGKNGGYIKKIGTYARKNIEEMTGCKVHLLLFVKVRKGWEDNPNFYHYMGLKLDS